MANIHVSWLDPHKTRKFTIVGTKKMLVFDDMEATEKIWIYDKGVGAPTDAMAFGEDLTLRFGEIKAPFLKMEEPLSLDAPVGLALTEEGTEVLRDGVPGGEREEARRAPGDERQHPWHRVQQQRTGRSG